MERVSHPIGSYQWIIFAARVAFDARDIAFFDRLKHHQMMFVILDADNIAESQSFLGFRAAHNLQVCPAGFVNNAAADSPTTRDTGFFQQKSLVKTAPVK